MDIISAEIGEPVQCSWDDIRQSTTEMAGVFPIKSVSAIVITQDCDAVRADDISFCEIRPFGSVEGKARSANSPNSFRKIITQQARLNQKWFYLPPDETLGFTEKMAVDFRVTLHIPRNDLQNYRHLRMGRLHPVALEHFQKRIGEFFSRYAYNEWYPLNQEELAAYIGELGELERYEWQNFLPDVSV